MLAKRLHWLLVIFSLYSANVLAEGQMETKTATFGGGCFWCMQHPFDSTKGVIQTTVGYTGGDTLNPTYETVSRGGTGHVEVVQVTYDPTQITYEELLNIFWKNVDPTAKDRQFCDSGSQYRSAIFYQDIKEEALAIQSKESILKSGKFNEVHTTLEPLSAYYLAENYHQNYYLKNPIRYKFYRYNCGRDKKLKALWGEQH